MSTSQTVTPGGDLSSRDLAVLHDLPALFLREGYIDNYLVYGTTHLHFEKVRKDLGTLPPALRMLMSLFFLNGQEPPEEVARAFSAEQVQSLLRLGLLMETAGQLHSGGLILLPVFGHLMFVPTPMSNPIVYFGDDSAALAVRLSPPRGARCLDLCSGPGIQALRSSISGGHVVAVEINPIAAACNELNIELNSLGGKVELRRGDLYAVLKPGEQFDFLSANPPLLPFVPDLPYPFVGHGGSDGLLVTWRILDKLPEVLADGGTAQIIGTCTGDEQGPHCRQQLADYASKHGLQVVFTVPSRMKLEPGSPWFDGLASTCAVATGLALDMVKERFAEHLVELGANKLYCYYLTITKGSPHPGFVMTRQYERPGGFWFR
ncbi:MAG: methyltransferase [Deltaproteobacteria bacterium]|nr:methyltransferase [Deltaproteobacteria bacterium]